MNKLWLLIIPFILIFIGVTIIYFIPNDSFSDEGIINNNLLKPISDYQIIIEITKAEHLDSNRTFIKDVYEYVKERNDNWTSIPSGNYLRVTFEEELDSTKDITIYARAGNESGVMVNGTFVPRDIYEKKLRIDKIMEELYG